MNSTGNTLINSGNIKSLPKVSNEALDQDALLARQDLACALAHKGHCPKEFARMLYPTFAKARLTVTREFVNWMNQLYFSDLRFVRDAFASGSLGAAPVAMAPFVSSGSDESLRAVKDIHQLFDSVTKSAWSYKIAAQDFKHFHLVPPDEMLELWVTAFARFPKPDSGSDDFAWQRHEFVFGCVSQNYPAKR